jgi:hypothetical protein
MKLTNLVCDKTLEEPQVDTTKKNSFKMRLLIESQQEYDK